jgi:2-methylaconitate cis-trans-isomerase PrpF
MRDTMMVRCAIYRGGTSRGVLFRANDLPGDAEARARILLAIFGSPDTRQIDGLGGANSQTSKTMIVAPSSRPESDVESTFGQVDIGRPMVDWGGNCGNMTSAIGPFAVDEGMVRVEEPTTTVRIYNTNTQKRIIATVPTLEGRARAEGDYRISGVPFPGARIDLEFTEPAGAMTGTLLPTGKPSEEFVLADGRRIRGSIVDAANPVVFVPAAELGLNGTELPPELEARPDVMATLEEVRGITAEMIGIVTDRREAKRKSPGVPKVAVVSSSRGYRTTGGTELGVADMDVVGRFLSMGTAHRSFPVTGAICTGAAAIVEGSVVREASCAPVRLGEPTILRIANPYGIMDVRVRWERESASPHVLGAALGRTARRLMEGYAYIPRRRVNL